mgnify:CR=1 FL=1
MMPVFFRNLLDYIPTFKGCVLWNLHYNTLYYIHKNMQYFLVKFNHNRSTNFVFCCKIKKNKHICLLFLIYLNYWIPYFFLNLSALPPVVSLFKLPVQNGWHFEQTSTFISFFVDPAFITFPHAHVIVVSA